MTQDRVVVEYGNDVFYFKVTRTVIVQECYNSCVNLFLAEWYKHPASYLGGISNALRDAVGER